LSDPWHVRDLVKHIPYIKNLTVIHEGWSFSDELQKLVHLQSLTIQDLRLQYVKNIKLCLTDLSKLQSLTFKDCQFNGENDFLTFDQGNITSLTFSYCQNFQGDFMCDVINLCAPTLERLVLQQCENFRIGQESFPLLKEFVFDSAGTLAFDVFMHGVMKTFTSLTILEISNIKGWKNTYFQKIQELLHSLPNLRVLISVQEVEDQVRCIFNQHSNVLFHNPMFQLKRQQPLLCVTYDEFEMTRNRAFKYWKQKSISLRRQTTAYKTYVKITCSLDAYIWPKNLSQTEIDRLIAMVKHRTLPHRFDHSTKNYAINYLDQVCWDLRYTLNPPTMECIYLEKLFDENAK
jgi:hypothetical protein